MRAPANAGWGDLRFAIHQVFDEAGMAPRTIIEIATAVSAGEFVRERLGVALLNPFRSPHS